MNSFDNDYKVLKYLNYHLFASYPNFIQFLMFGCAFLLCLEYANDHECLHLDF
jgi:hypothetical protein